MEHQKNSWPGHRLAVVKGIAGIICTALLVFTLISCEQPENPAVAPVITITTQPATKTAVTEGSITGFLTVTANISDGKAPAYQWYSNTCGNTIGGTIISGQTNAWFTIPVNLTLGTHYYFCEVSASGVVSVRSNAAEVTVSASSPNSFITITTQPAANTMVTEGSITGILTVTANVSDDKELAYQWYSNTNYSNVGGTMINGATNAWFIIPANLIEGMYYYYCEINAPGAVFVHSGVATVMVSQRPVVTITTQPAATTTVTESSISGNLMVMANVSNGTIPAYQWYFNTSNSSTGGTIISDATSMWFTIPANLTEGTYYFFCELSASGAISVRSDVAAVTVLVISLDPVIIITTEPASSTIVTEGNISGSLTVVAHDSNGATPVYQWYSNASSNTTGGTIISGATNAAFAIPADLTAGTYYYFCELSSSRAVSVRSRMAIVTVNPRPVITIVLQPAASTTVIEGGITGNLTISASGTLGVELGYQWYSSNSNTGPALISGQTNEWFTIPADLTVGTYYYFCELSASGAVSVRSEVARVTVDQPLIAITSQPAANTTVVEGSIIGSLTIAANVNNGVPPTFQWYLSSDRSTAGGTAIAGETNAWFVFPRTLTGGTYYYFCEVNTNGVAPVRSNVAVVTVEVSTEFIIQLSAITEADVIAQTAYTVANTNKSFTISGSGYTAYQWYLDGTPAGTSLTYRFNRDAGVYELAVVVTNAAGRKYSGSCRVTVR